MADSDFASFGSTASESFTEIDLEESDEDRQEDQPDRVCFTNMMVEGEREEDVATFVYNCLLVPLKNRF